MRRSITKFALVVGAFAFGVGLASCTSDGEEETEEVVQQEQQEGQQEEEPDLDQESESLDGEEVSQQEDTSYEDAEPSLVDEDTESAEVETVDLDSPADDTTSDGDLFAEDSTEPAAETSDSVSDDQSTGSDSMADSSASSGSGDSGDSFEYVVVLGDTVSKVAAKIYGSPSEWRTIAEATGMSNPNLIFPGNILRIPLTSDAARDFKQRYDAGKTNGGEEVTVTVESGDTLSSIAKEHLGHPDYWSKIFGQNRSKIQDPNRIQTGQVLNFTRGQSAMAH